PDDGNDHQQFDERKGLHFWGRAAFHKNHLLTLVSERCEPAGANRINPPVHRIFFAAWRFPPACNRAFAEAGPVAHSRWGTERSWAPANASAPYVRRRRSSWPPDCG